jgi:hypothetical protein
VVVVVLLTLRTSVLPLALVVITMKMALPIRVTLWQMVLGLA